jgi:predicted nucleic acid-binding protein
VIIEVDQSNKIEQTSRDTILALANDEIFTVVIPARVKREAFERLKRKRKDKKTVCLQLFAAGLFS